MVLQLVGAVAVGVLTSVGTWFVRRRAWKVAFWTGGSLLALVVLMVDSLLLWVAAGGGQGGESFPVGPVLLFLASCIAILVTMNALIVGAIQATSLDRPFLKVVVSGYLDCAPAFVLSLINLSSIFAGNGLNYIIAAEAGWLVSLVWIGVVTRKERTDAI